MPYTSDSWTFGHVPTTFKRLPTVNRWGVLHGFYSDQRDDQELSNSAPDMPSGVGFRILANRSIWRFPNIEGYLNSANLGNIDAGYVLSWNGALRPNRVRNGRIVATQENNNYVITDDANFDASKSNALFGSSDTNQPKSLRALCLIRAYQA